MLVNVCEYERMFCILLYLVTTDNSGLLVLDVNV